MILKNQLRLKAKLAVVDQTLVKAINQEVFKGFTSSTSAFTKRFSTLV